jgi:hypothetical protein
MEPTLKKIQDGISDRIIMQRVIGEGVRIIRQRTKKGEFLKGSSPGADKYSTHPLGIPLLAYGKKVANELMQRAENNQDVKLYRNKKTGGLWALVMGGYKEIRRMAGKNTDSVSMNWSGNVLRNLAGINIKPMEGNIGLTDERAKQIAIWQQVKGAGKSKKKKVFIGFSQKEINKLTDLAGKEIIKSVIKKLS